MCRALVGFVFYTVGGRAVVLGENTVIYLHSAILNSQLFLAWLLSWAYLPKG